ncbi:zinc knuckle CX2CX4HX4C containing protein [Tanacetum coccineum]|uniref:Zinc knuckle CX2CX4HX4C containing protein n=1 Tax=Tanacetum coccineum TaxID=301880 RepID=A0ABQ5HTF5_9ASTR
MSSKRHVGKMSTINEEVEFEGMETRDTESVDFQDGDLNAGKESNEVLQASGQKRMSDGINLVGEVNGTGNDKNKIRSSVSFANVAQGMANSGNKLIDLDLNVKEVSNKWELTIIGYFVGMKMGYREILGHLRRMWRMYDLDKIIVLENGLYYFKFSSEEGMQTVIENGPWIASRLGTPIIMDRITTSMCDHSYRRASYARDLIEVDAIEGLVHSIEAYYKSIGRTMSLKVEYAWVPPICSHYKVFGHHFQACKNRELTEEEIERLEEWRMAYRNVNRASSSKPATTQYVPFGNKGSNDSNGFENVSKRLSALGDEDVGANIDEDQVAGNDSDIANARAKELVKEKVQDTGLTKNLAIPGLYDEMYRQKATRIKELKLRNKCWKWTYSCIFKFLRAFNSDGNEDMGDEVAKDTSAHASFMTQNNVSNVVESDMAQM